MELTKLNEAYNLTDSLENGWTVKGQVIKEDSGVININFSVNYLSITENIHIGNYSYNVPIDNSSIFANYSCRKEFETEFINYSEELIKQILEQL